MRQLLQAITTWEWLLLLLLLPLLVFSSSFGALTLLILPAFWLVRKITTGHFFPDTPYNVTILALALAVLISFLAVFDIELSFPKIAGVTVGIALYFAAVEHSRQKVDGVWFILAAVFLVGTAISIISVPFANWVGPFRFLHEASTLLPIPASGLPGSADGFVNVNELAGVLAWIVPLLIAVTFGSWQQLWHSNHWQSRLVLLCITACLLINVFFLLASGSRGGILSVIIAILVMLAIEFTWGRWLLLIGFLAGIILVYSFGFDLLLATPSDATNTLGMQGRLEVWSRGIYGFSDFPLTGMSMNGFRHLVHVLYPLFTLAPGTDIGHVHNHLLQAGLDLGIVGLVAYLAIWFLSAGLLWNVLRHKAVDDPYWHPLQLGLAGSLLAGWFFGVLDTIALGAKPGFIWWLLIALVVASTTNLNHNLSAKQA